MKLRVLIDENINGTRSKFMTFELTVTLVTNTITCRFIELVPSKELLSVDDDEDLEDEEVVDNGTGKDDGYRNCLADGDGDCADSGAGKGDSPDSRPAKNGARKGDSPNGRPANNGAGNGSGDESARKRKRRLAGELSGRQIAMKKIAAEEKVRMIKMIKWPFNNLF